MSKQPVVDIRVIRNLIEIVFDHCKSYLFKMKKENVGSVGGPGFLEVRRLDRGYHEMDPDLPEIKINKHQNKI